MVGCCRTSALRQPLSLFRLCMADKQSDLTWSSVLTSASSVFYCGAGDVNPSAIKCSTKYPQCSRPNSRPKDRP